MSFRKFALKGLQVLKAALLVILSLMAGYVAAETTEGDHYKMLVVSNQAFGEQLLTGSHTAAIERIRTTPEQLEQQFDTAVAAI